MYENLFIAQKFIDNATYVLYWGHYRLINLSQQLVEKTRCTLTRFNEQIF